MKPRFKYEYSAIDNLFYICDKKIAFGMIHITKLIKNYKILNYPNCDNKLTITN